MNSIAYRSDINNVDLSYNVVIYNHYVNNVAIKVKMKYFCNKHDEDFSAQTLVNNRWEFLFNMFDLGFESKAELLIGDIFARQDRFKLLELKGLEFVEKVLR